MPVELEEEPTDAGLASLGDAFGSRLNEIKAAISHDDNEGTNDSSQDSSIPKEQSKPDEKKQEEPKKEDAKPEVKPPPKEDKPDPKAAQAAAQTEKDKRRAKDIPLDEREYLLANEAKRLELVTGLKKQIEDLRAELDPTKLKVGELEKSVAEKTKLQSEIEVLRQEKEAVLKEKQDLAHKVTAYSVRETPEYLADVQEPWNKNVIGAVNALKDILDAPKLYAIAHAGDEAALEEFLGEIQGERAKARVNAIYDAAQAIKAKDEEYAAKGPKAMEEITANRTKVERDKAEQSRKERNNYFGEIDAAATQYFPFLAGEKDNEGLNNALMEAKSKMGEFDYNKLNPAQQAYVAHLFTHSGIITHVQAQKLDQVSKELDKLKTEQAENDLKHAAEIEKLNERLGNQAGTRISAGSGKNRGDDGKFVSGEVLGVEDLFNKSLEQARRNS